MLNIFKRVSIPNIETDEFKTILNSEKNTILLDVRTKREFHEGHIPGALHINIQDRDFNQNIKDLDKAAHYLVYCRSGRRSMLACRIMDAKGFKNTYNLKGGIIKWSYEVV